MKCSLRKGQVDFWKLSDSEPTWPRTMGGRDGGVSAGAALELAFSHARAAAYFNEQLKGLHSRVMRVFLDIGEPQRVFEYVAMLPAIPAVHGALMFELSKHGGVDDVAVALEMRQRLNIPLDKCAPRFSAVVSVYVPECRGRRASKPRGWCRYTLSSMLTTAMRHSRRDLADEYVAAGRAANVEFDGWVYNTLLNIYADVADAQAYNEVWAEMVAAGIAPTTYSHVAYAKVLSKTAGAEEVYAHVDLMMRDHSDMLSGPMFTILFSVAAADNRMSFPRLHDLWRRMVANGIQPSQYLLNSFLSACKELPMEASEVDTCFRMLLSLRRDADRNKLSVGLLAGMLAILARNDKLLSLRVLDVWHLVQKDGLRLNPKVVCSMLTCCRRILPNRAVMRLLPKLSQWLEHRWLEVCKKPWLPHSERDICYAFNALLACYGRTRHYDTARSSFDVRPPYSPLCLLPVRPVSVGGVAANGLNPSLSK